MYNKTTLNTALKPRPKIDPHVTLYKMKRKFLKKSRQLKNERGSFRNNIYENHSISKRQFANSKTVY